MSVTEQVPEPRPRIRPMPASQHWEVASDVGWTDGIEARPPRSTAGWERRSAEAYYDGYALGVRQRSTRIRQAAGVAGEPKAKLPGPPPTSLPPEVREQHALAYVVGVCAVVVVVLVLAVVFGRG
jgi:hypothetical protein